MRDYISISECIATPCQAGVPIICLQVYLVASLFASTIGGGKDSIITLDSCKAASVHSLQVLNLLGKSTPPEHVKSIKEHTYIVKINFIFVLTFSVIILYT